METFRDLSEQRLLRHVTLSFHDPDVEKAFLDEDREHLLQAAKDILPWGAFFIIIALVVMMIFFPALTVLPKLCVMVLGLCLLVFFYIHFSPPDARYAQLIFSIIGMSITWLYIYLLITLDTGVSNLQIYVVAIHIVGITFILPLRFVYCLSSVFPGTLLGFGLMMFHLTKLDRFNIVWQCLFLGGLFFFCLLAIYQREASARKNFYQRRIIETQRQKLENEQKKSEALLLNILPAEIAIRLKEEHQTIAEAFDETSILFADIVGFTILSGQVSPEKLVEILNELFSTFDDLAEKHSLEKIKTIGDAYMLVAGLPTRRNDHAEAIAEIALDMRQAIAAYNTGSGMSLQIRIGIHSGPVVAGVIGKKKFAYDLWGDAVNTAARMESHGLPNEIQVTQASYDLLYDRFLFEERGIIEVKGKGPMQVYLLRRSRA